MLVNVTLTERYVTFMAKPWVSLKSTLPGYLNTFSFSVHACPVQNPSSRFLLLLMNDALHVPKQTQGNTHHMGRVKKAKATNWYE